MGLSRTSPICGAGEQEGQIAICDPAAPFMSPKAGCHMIVTCQDKDDFCVTSKHTRVVSKVVLGDNV